jgi:hypothetical protein
MRVGFCGFFEIFPKLKGMPYRVSAASALNSKSHCTWK